VSSVAGLRATGSSIPYAASKAALNHLTTLLAKVVRDLRFASMRWRRASLTLPGRAIGTPIRKYVSNVAPLRRSGTAEDVADVIVALATTSYVTGQIVVVDGGLSPLRPDVGQAPL
jgi:ketoreductase RED2